MASRRKHFRLSTTSLENMKNHPATVERFTDPEETFLIRCESQGFRSYLYDSLGFPLKFKSFDSAQRFINTFK